MDRLCSKLVSLLLSVTDMLRQTHQLTILSIHYEYVLFVAQVTGLASRAYTFNHYSFIERLCSKLVPLLLSVTDMLRQTHQLTILSIHYEYVLFCSTGHRPSQQGLYYKSLQFHRQIMQYASVFVVVNHFDSLGQSHQLTTQQVVQTHLR